MCRAPCSIEVRLEGLGITVRLTASAEATAVREALREGGSRTPREIRVRLKADTTRDPGLPEGGHYASPCNPSRSPWPA